MSPEINNIVSKSSLEAAPLLLGCELVRQTPKGLVKLKIVETEAYHQDDPASHSFRGITLRTAPMFNRGGLIYVYFTYGMHYCINIVTGRRGVGEAVLLRAAEPLEGIEIIKNNRGIEDVKNLTNGPGKLAQALGITDTKLSGERLSKNSLQLLPPKTTIPKEKIAVSPRIGIRRAVEQPWRFYIKGSPFVSRYTSFKAG